MRKSKKLGLSFPYDWSNPDIGDDALILNVLERGIFEDICRICAAYGMDTVNRLIPETQAPESPTLTRMLENIKIGFSRVEIYSTPKIERLESLTIFSARNSDRHYVNVVGDSQTHDRSNSHKH